MRHFCIKLIYKSRQREEKLNVNIQESRQYLMFYKHSFNYKNSGYNLRTQLDHFLYTTNEDEGFCQNKAGPTLSHNAHYQKEVQRNRINSPAPTFNFRLGSCKSCRNSLKLMELQRLITKTEIN